jgi:hypothetical protein
VEHAVPKFGYLSMMKDFSVWWWAQQMQTAANRGDWEAVEAGWDRLEALHTKLGESDSITVALVRGDLPGPTVHQILRIVERHGATLTTERLLAWRARIEAGPTVDWQSAYDRVAHYDTWCILYDARERGRWKMPDEADEVYSRPLVANHRALVYPTMLQDSAKEAQAVREDLASVIAGGLHRQVVGNGYYRWRPWLGETLNRTVYYPSVSLDVARRMVGSHLKAETTRLLALAAIDATLYRREHGGWPPDLARVNERLAATLDPFATGKEPFKMWVDPAGCLRIYSVGLNQVDDDGVIYELDAMHYPQAGTDLGLRLVPPGWTPPKSESWLRPPWFPPMPTEEAEE